MIELESALRERGLRPVELLSVGDSATVLRVTRSADGAPLVAKCVTDRAADDRVIARFRHEHDLIASLPGGVAPEVVAFTRVGDHWVMLQRDTGAQSLDRLAAGRAVEPRTAIAWALGIARALERLHQQGIVHRDVNPGNVILEPGAEAIRLIDLGIAARLPVAREAFVNPRQIEGTLAYMSAEQAGRLHREVDGRADLYALGVTLFELLTGRLPFTSSDPLALLHDHVTRAAPAPSGFAAAIPPALDAIVARLLAKLPEARYHSAAGVARDLELALQHDGRGAFVAGRHDLAGEIPVAGRLYGRAAAIEALRGAFNAGVAGETAGALVAGYSGVGKSALVNELRADVTAHHGLVFEAKFDAVRRSRPLEGVEQLLRSMADYLLAEPEPALALARQRLVEALGEGAALLCRLSPRLGIALGLGRRPDSADDERAATGRIEAIVQAFARLLGVWAESGPVVLFFDDLQWADASDIDVLGELLRGAGGPRCLPIGAWRSNEVGPGHPLHTLTAQLDRLPRGVRRIDIEPLGEPDLDAWLRDSFGLDDATRALLRHVTWTRTGGNPFFVLQLLRSLHEQRIVMFDPGRAAWGIPEPRRLDEAVPTAHVVDLVLRAVSGLAAPTVEVLEVASVLGATFSVGAVAEALHREPGRVARDLEPAIRAGLVTFRNSRRAVAEVAADASGRRAWETLCGFVHDRVQQAVFERIDAVRRDDLAVEAGRALVAEALRTGDPVALVEAVAHLEAGASRVANPDERAALPHLLLAAAEHALGTAQFATAERFASSGLRLIGTSGDTAGPAVAAGTGSATGWWAALNSVEPAALEVPLRLVCAEASYLLGDFDQADALHAELAQRPLTLPERLRAHRIRIDQCLLQARFDDGVDVCRSALSLLGVPLDLPAGAGGDYLAALHRGVLEELLGRGVGALREAPWRPSPELTARIHALYGLFLCAYLTGRSPLWQAAVASVVTTTLTEGNAPLSGYGIIAYAMAVTLDLGERQLGHAIATTGLAVSEERDDETIRARSNFIYAADVHAWTQPIERAQASYDRAYALSLRHGDWLTAGYVAMLSGSDFLTAGWPLPQLRARVEAHLELLRLRNNHEAAVTLRAGVLQPLLHLMGETRSWDSFDTDTFDEARYLEAYRGNAYNLAWLYSGRIRAALLIGDPGQYGRWADCVEGVTEVVPSHTKTPECTFYGALLRLRLADATVGDERARHLALAARYRDRLAAWAADAPGNLACKRQILEAEWAARQPDEAAAVRAYEAAIAAAEVAGRTSLRALACELFGRFWMARGLERLGLRLLREASDAWADWGATGRVQALRRELAGASAARVVEPPRPGGRAGTVMLPMDRLDLEAAARAASGIASITRRDEVVGTLVETAVQVSGATLAALLFDGVEVACCVEGRVRMGPTEPGHGGDPEARHGLWRRVERLEETCSVTHGGRRMVALPLRVGGRLRGILHVEADSAVSSLDGPGLRLLEHLGSYLGSTLDNATLYEQLRDANEDLIERGRMLEWQMASSRTLVSCPTSSWNEPLDRELAGFAELVGARSVELLVRRSGEAPAECVARWPRAAGDGEGAALSTVRAARLLEQAHASGLAVLEVGSEGDAGDAPTTLLREQGDTTAVCAAVHGTQGATGALLVTRPGPREAWRPAHLAALRIFADTVSSLLQRVHADELYRHSEQARHRSLAATVAGLAHELNTPLGVALTAESVFAGELERLASDHPGISLRTLQRASQLMRSNVERAAQHVRTFRSVVLEQTHDGLTDIDLRGFVEHVVASLAPLLRRHRLAATLAPTPAVEVVASCNPGRIAQVVTNLIENAGLHAYGPDGGPLAFEVTSHGRFARIRVADRGAGMSSAIASRCMEPFYTSRRHEGGTGLGLFIVRQVIQDEHRGCVELQTAPGQGTDWVLEFPLRSHPGDAKG